MIKVIITGSNGLLGQSLLSLLLQEKEKYQVFGFSRGQNRSGRNDFSFVSIDITNEKNLKNKIKVIQPNFIINTAAMTLVDDWFSIDLALYGTLDNFIFMRTCS